MIWFHKFDGDRDPINLAVLSLKENGELAKLVERWWYERTECRHSDKPDAARNELSLSNVAGIFYILIGGLLLALAVALLEFCYKSHTEATRAKVMKSRETDRGYNFIHFYFAYFIMSKINSNLSYLFKIYIIFLCNTLEFSFKKIYMIDIIDNRIE